ncbi:MAG: DUF3597 family protein, partial [Burkholderiaceae bacterium]
MSLFSAILEKLGLGKKAEAPVEFPVPSPTEPASTEVPVVPISQVDVVAKLTGLAAANSQKLNWKVSIVDLLQTDPRVKLSNVSLVRLFSPEHGIRGDQDVTNLPDMKDEKSGL